MMTPQSNRYLILAVIGSILVAISCLNINRPKSPTQTASTAHNRADLQLIAGVEHDGSDIPDRS